MKNDIFSLAGKAAVVTGASRGLGKAMALGLARAGADVAVTDILDTKETVEEIKKIGRRSVGFKLDITDGKNIDSTVENAVREFKKIDILINNAGVYYPTPAADMKEEDWDKLMNINLRGSTMCAKAFGRQMIMQKSGNIINVASVAGIMAFAQSVAYNQSKAAIIMLTKTLAAEWASYNIRVNTICPGVFVTDMTKDLIDNESFRTMIKTSVPLGRYGTPDELSGAAVYLASDASGYTTGHALVVDGGWTVHL
jgi:NAD(P)-dependent dehydrogenase (short-subunit alcohol dehydrogenase family)